MTDEVRIDYEKLVADYLQGLTTVLRGFQAGSGHDFLATWVCDEKEIRGVLGVIEAAQDGGVRCLVIRLGPATLRKLDLMALKELASEFAKVRVEQGDWGADLRVEFTGRDHAAQDIFRQSPVDDRCGSGTRVAPHFQSAQRGGQDGSSPYEDGLRHAARSATHGGVLADEPGRVLVKTSCDGVVLSALVDSSRHTVTRAAYQGVNSEMQTGLLEALCGVMEGKPILEVSDHGVVCLESELRDHHRPRPVAGIVMAENADPMFALPLRLVRMLLAEYRRTTGFQGIENFYSPPLSVGWKALSEEERIYRLREAIATHPSGYGIELVQLEMADRVVVRFQNGHESSVMQTQLMQLEAHFKQALEPNLQVYIQPKIDENKMRRIKEQVV